MGTLIENRDEAQKAVWQMRDARDVRESELRRAKGVLETAKRYGYKTVDAHQSAVTALEAEYAQACSDYNAAKQREEQAEFALYEARKARNVAREAEALALLGDPADIRFRVDWRGTESTWHMQVIMLNDDGTPCMRTSKGHDGKTYEYVEERFGYSATIYGARRTWRGEWEDATISWGGVSPMTAREGREMLRVHTMSLTIAEWLDAKRDAWRDEDLVD